MRLQNESARLVTASKADEIPEGFGGTTGTPHLTPAHEAAQDASRRFLEQFPPQHRSRITNLFCFSVRAGHCTAQRILACVRADAEKHLRSRFLDLEVRAALHELVAALSTPEAERFAVFILNRESLPLDERERMKAEQSARYQQEWMRQQEPTAKQLAYLAALGCQIAPDNRLEASKLIDLLKQRGRRALPPPVAVTQGGLFERIGGEAA